MTNTNKNSLVGGVKKVRLRIKEQAERNVQKYRNLDESTILALLAIYRVSALMDRYQREELVDTGLNAIEFNALMVLNEVEEPISMGDLSSMIAIRPTNLSGIIGSLRKLGFVDQAFDENDRRSRVVWITKTGIKFMDDFLPKYWRRLDAVMAPVKGTDFEAFVNSLRRLGTTLEQKLEQ